MTVSPVTMDNAGTQQGAFGPSPETEPIDSFPKCSFDAGVEEFPDADF
jgi:hypothetical protein